MATRFVVMRTENTIEPVRVCRTERQAIDYLEAEESRYSAMVGAKISFNADHKKLHIGYDYYSPKPEILFMIREIASDE